MDAPHDMTSAGNILLVKGKQAITVPPARCSQCRERLPASFFPQLKETDSGWRGRCHACCIGAKHVWRDHLRKIPTHKVCKGPICGGKELPSDSFHRIKKAKDGLQDHCRDCQAEIKRRRALARDSMPEGSPQSSAPRLCNVCWSTKPPKEFLEVSYKGNRMVETTRSDCRACHSILMREKREAHAARLAGGTHRF